MAQQEVKLPQGASYGQSSSNGEAPLPQGATFGVSQSNIDDTGIVGPDQTAPNAGLAPPAGANKNIVPARAVGTLRTDFYDKDFNPVTETNQPRKAGLLERLFTGTAGHAQQGMESLGVDPLTEPTQSPQVVKGINQFTRAGLNWSTPLLPVAAAQAPVRTGLTLAAAYGGNKVGEKVGDVVAPNDPDIKELLRNIGGFAAGGLTAHHLFKGPSPNPDPEKAFNVIAKGNASSDEPSILPEIRNAASKEAASNPANPLLSKLPGVRPKLSIPQGKAGLRVPEQMTQKAINAHEAEVQPIKQQFEGEAIDNSPARNAALSQITPEMRVAAASGDKGVIGQISAIEDIANRAGKATTIGNTDQLRHSWNDELSGNYGKSEAAQSVAPPVTQAKQAALNTLRGSFYTRLGELSGQDLSPIAKREGLLMEAKTAVRKSADTALEGGARNDKTFLGRVLTGSDRDAGGVSSVAPAKASFLEVPINILRAMKNPDFGTPIGDYHARVKRTFANLPEAQPVQAPPFPGGRLPVQQSLPTVRGPLFDIQQTPDTKAPSSPAIPAGEEKSLLTPGKGKGRGKASPYQSNQPVAAHISPQDRAAMEKAPYGGFRVGSDEIPNFGQTRRPLVGEEYPQIVPPEVVQASQPTPSPTKLPPVSGESTLSISPSHIEIVKNGIQMEPTSSGGARLRFSMNYRGNQGIFEGNEANLGKQLFPNLSNQIEPTESQILRKSEFSRGFGAQHYGEDQGQYHVTIGFKNKEAAQQAYTSLTGGLENSRGTGLAARGDKGSVIPERGKGFVTNEAAERRALPRSTQAQLLTSEANEIRRSIAEATTPEEKAYHEQRLQMKLEEIDKLGLPPELHSAIQASPKVKAAKK